ncbi:MAG: rhomboid family intramembrane serine protease [Bacteroidetes bacterium]|nr:rhomboid family intramembrane serine protease [Bacteroidota bacterium]
MVSGIQEKKHIFNSLLISAVIILLMWAVKFSEMIFDISFGFLGVYPLSWKGLPGIVLAPFVHADLKHISANSVPLFVLMLTLFYFYRKIAFKVLILIWLFTGFWVWIGAREAYHIGASGIVYGLAAFLFISGLIRKNPRLMAISMIVAFLYGSLIWGVFPELFPEENISWESHLLGLVAGTLLALYFRKEGPQRKQYSWELEEEDEEDEDDPHAYWKRTVE